MELLSPNTYAVLIALGLLLFTIEFFAPGGILGIIGGLLLLLAVPVGFSDQVFGSRGGILSALGILLGLIGYFLLIFQVFPTSRFGRAVSLTASLKEDPVTYAENQALLGSTGTAHSDLRPGGIASINEQRIDVVAEGKWIGRGAAIKIVEVAGNRIVVREVPV